MGTGKLDPSPELPLIQFFRFSMIQHCPQGRVKGFLDVKRRPSPENPERDRNLDADFSYYRETLFRYQKFITACH
jgi:hypothetical protein